MKGEALNLKGAIRWVSGISLLICSFPVFAGGIGVGYVQESISRTSEYGSSSDTEDLDPSGYKLHGYFGDIRNSHFEFSYSSLAPDDGNDEVALGLSWFQPVWKQGSLIPHIKLGIGYGWKDIDVTIYDPSTGDTRQKRYNYSLHAGAGASYMVTESFGVRGTAEYLYRSWESLSDYSNTLTTSGSGLRFTGGAFINF